MRVVMAAAFVFILLLVVVYDYKKNNKDIFSPMIFYCFFVCLRYFPGILYIENWSYIIIDDEAAFTTFLHQLIAILFVFLGYTFAPKIIFLAKNDIALKTQYRKRNLRHIGYFIFILGILSNWYSIYNVGGLSVILSGYQKYDIGAGNSYFLALSFLSVIGLCFLMKANFYDKHKIIDFSFIIMFLLAMTPAFLRTSRSPIFEAMMIMTIFYHYSIKRINISFIMKPKFICVIIVSLFLLIILPEFRSASGFNDLDIFETLSKSLGRLNRIALEFCYTARDSFIYKNYNESNFWYGAGIINLICAPIPSNFYPEKPIVDDGIYLANAVIGNFISPPSNDYIWYNSFPISSSGTLFINFGLIGLVIGSFLMGFLYNKFYFLVKVTEKDLILPILYQLIIYQYEISVLSTVQTLMPFLLTVIIAKLTVGWKIYSTKINDYSFF